MVDALCANQSILNKMFTLLSESVDLNDLLCYRCCFSSVYCQKNLFFDEVVGGIGGWGSESYDGPPNREVEFRVRVVHPPLVRQPTCVFLSLNPLV